MHFLALALVLGIPIKYNYTLLFRVDRPSALVGGGKPEIGKLI